VKIRRRKFIQALGASVASLSILGHPRADAAEPENGTTTNGSLSEAASPGAAMTLKTRTATLCIDSTGAISDLTISGRNVLASRQPSPLLSLRVNGEFHAANHATWNAARSALTLDYDAIGARAVVAVREKPTHVTFELTELRAAQHVELALWGPFPLTIGDLVGEVVGVVRDSEVAVGIQALNVKTLGGYPSHESDIEPDGTAADDPGHYPGFPDELRKQQSWRGDTARHMPFGSSLQAYCRNRDRVRIIENWGNPRFVALPFDDGGVVGSKIALFACPASEALSVLGEIEVAEGLPHPMMDGVWAKMSPHATASYLIADFAESTIDRAIAMTLRDLGASPAQARRLSERLGWLPRVRGQGPQGRHRHRIPHPLQLHHPQRSPGYPQPRPSLGADRRQRTHRRYRCGANGTSCRRPYVLSEENRDEYRNGRRGTGQVRRGLRRSAVAAAPL
jgi:hypothetical protein